MARLSDTPEPVRPLVKTPAIWTPPRTRGKCPDCKADIEFEQCSGDCRCIQRVVIGLPLTHVCAGAHNE